MAGSLLRIASDPAEADSILGMDRSITVKDASVLLGCDGGTVRRLLDAGELSGHRVGIKKRGVRIFLSSVEEYRTNNLVCPTSKPKSPASKPRNAASRPSDIPAERKEALAFLRKAGVLIGRQ